MQRNRILALSLALIAPSGMWAADPLSAIDWLTHRPKQQITVLEPLIDEPAVAGAISTPEISVTPLDAPTAGSAGLLPSSVTGLPHTLWAGSSADDLIALMGDTDAQILPALQSLYITLLLAEANAPDHFSSDAFLGARLHALTAIGAIEPAQALVARSGEPKSSYFNQAFEISLLLGDADSICKTLARAPAISPDLSARIYCGVQVSDWDAAALTFTTAKAIGALDGVNASLLERYLDPELSDSITLPAPPQNPSALQFRLFEAIGEPLSLNALPKKFGAAALGGDFGWKTQIESAERLARAGSLSPNRLLGFYTSHVPSASGGVWDRAEAIQTLEAAIKSGDPVALRKRLEDAAVLMDAEGLLTSFATLFAKAINDVPVALDETNALAQLKLLTPDYETAARTLTTSPELDFARSVAAGEPTGATTPLETAIMRGFENAAPDPEVTAMLESDQLGELLLKAIEFARGGPRNDPQRLEEVLHLLRVVGLEDTARRTALQALLLGETGQ